MAQDKPELTTTEMRQGNSRKMNMRVLVFGGILAAIGLALVIWFFSATYQDTPATIGGGTAVEDIEPATDEPDSNLENAPMPVPEG